MAAHDEAGELDILRCSLPSDKLHLHGIRSVIKCWESNNRHDPARNRDRLDTVSVQLEWEASDEVPEPLLLNASKQYFFKTSKLDFKILMGDQDNIAENLFSSIQAFSPAVRDIFECFDFHIQVERLAKANLLYLVAEKFTNIDLHPDVVTNE